MGCGSDNITTPADLERSQQDKMITANLGRIKRKIVVMSGKGGVGKSSVATYLALLLSSKGFKVGLLDVDLHGPSVPNMIKLKGGLNMPEKGVVRPNPYSENLGVVSMGMLMEEKDSAVIWRGPLKISAIRQFISDIEWGDLDFLVVDSPPGTGDEPLTVAQTISDADAVIVTTPQEVSLADVRKSISFCRQVNMNILGVIENMSGFSCPHCGENSAIFGEGGAEVMSSELDIPMLGVIPIDPKMVEMADNGGLNNLMDSPDLAINKAYEEILNKIIE